MVLRGFHSILIHRKFIRSITLGIRREGKNRWECRVPLIPTHVQQLLLEIPSSRIIVQPSCKRVYPDEVFEKAGAEIQEDLGSCDVILGVKEVATKDLLPNKTYMFFSHTHKGQLHNMAMLEHITKNNISLVDYELLVNDKGKRTVMFGAFAGFSGAINALHGLGDRLLYAGYKTPFLNLGLAHHYPSLESAKAAISQIGKEIQDHGLNRKLGPIIFCVTGHGNVSTGVVDILKLLPIEFVTPAALPKLCQETFDTRKVYCVQVTPKDYLKYEGEFHLEDYYKEPAKYESIFHEKIAPYITLLFNGIYWDTRFPRLLTVPQLNKLALAKNLRLLSIADISCDLNGSIEFVSKTTLIERPFFIYDPLSGDKSYADSEAKGIQVMAIDNLPTQLPKDASEYFSKALYPYVSDLLKNATPSADLYRAYITDKGKLLPKHKHLASLFSKTTVMDVNGQGVLLLGSGLVSGPFVRYFKSRPNTRLTIAGNGNFSAYENEKSIKLEKLDVENIEALEALVRDADIVVSLLPAALHPAVAQACIKYKKHMVTASYESPAIKALDEEAKKAGITILNEIGLDPGIDHLAAMSVIDAVKEAGGKVREFVSWCGGLPAPEHSNNPFGYKFSWSPRGVLLATLNSAKYRKDHVTIEIEGSKLMSSAVPVDMYPGFAFEGIPNRDSLKYESQYGLEEMKTMFRGTLRFKGYASLMRGCQTLGLIDTTPEKMKTVSHCSTWAETMKVILQSDTPFFENSLAEKLGDAQQAEKLYEALQWLGAFSLYQSFDKKAPSILDAFCSLLQEKLAYCPDERDLVFLSHSFVTENAQGNREYITSTLVSFGDPKGDSAMAKTVGLPTAIATDLILRGSVQEKGVIVPTSPLIYKPLLSELEKQGIAFVEKKSSFASRVFVP